MPITPLAGTSAGSVPIAASAAPGLRPLTEQDVLAMTHLCHAKDVDLRMLGMLNWVEHAKEAALKQRIEFVNAVVDRILAMPLEPDRSLTLISFGASGLLTEYFIHQRLVDAGIIDIRWRFIANCYASKNCLMPVDDFSEKTGVSYSWLAGEQYYLRQAGGSPSICVKDRSDGATVVLSINPPSHNISCGTKPALDHKLKGCLMLRGKMAHDCEEANCLFVICSEPEKIERNFDGLRRKLKEEKIPWINYAIKIYLTQRGEVKTCVSSDENSQCMNAFLQPCLSKIKKTIDHPNKSDTPVVTFGMRHIVKAAEMMGKELLKLEPFPLATRQLLFCDYDLGWDNLCDFMRDGGQPFLSALFTYKGPVFP